MNPSYICKSERSSERHMLEHLMFYRTSKYEQPASFYKYMYDKGASLNFYSSYDYTEITFYNVTDSLIGEIDEAFKTFFFTEQDFDSEKRVILIECDNYDYDKVKTEMSLLAYEYDNLCDRETFEKLTFEDMLNIKESFVFEKMIFADNTKDIKDINFDKVEKIAEKNNNNLTSFSFKKNPLVYELAELLYKCFYVSNFEDGISFNRVFTLKESTIILSGILDRSTLANVLNGCVEKNFDSAYGLFMEEVSPNGVSYELLGNLNIKNLFSKEELKGLLENFIKEICK